MGGDINKVGIFGDVSYFSDVYYVLLFLPIAVISTIVLIVVYDLIIRFFNYIYYALHLGKKGESEAEDITLATLAAGTEEKRKEDEKNEDISALPIVDNQEKEKQDANLESKIKQKTESDFGCGCFLWLGLLILVILIIVDKFRNNSLNSIISACSVTLNNVIGYILAGILILAVLGGLFVKKKNMAEKNIGQENREIDSTAEKTEENK